jgi:starch phosphorylase
MDTRTVVSSAASIEAGRRESDLLRQYDCGAVPLPHETVDSFHRHLAFDHLVDPGKASMRQRFQALSRSVRDLLAQRWLKTKATYHQ